MKNEKDLVKVFAGIGLSTGFPNTSNVPELYANQHDEKEAKIVVNDFVNNSQ